MTVKKVVLASLITIIFFLSQETVYAQAFTEVGASPVCGSPVNGTSDSCSVVADGVTFSGDPITPFARAGRQFTVSSSPALVRGFVVPISSASGFSSLEVSSDVLAVDILVNPAQSPYILCFGYRGVPASEFTAYGCDFYSDSFTPGLGVALFLGGVSETGTYSFTTGDIEYLMPGPDFTGQTGVSYDDVYDSIFATFNESQPLMLLFVVLFTVRALVVFFRYRLLEDNRT